MFKTKSSEILFPDLDQIFTHKIQQVYENTRDLYVNKYENAIENNLRFTFKQAFSTLALYYRVFDYCLFPKPGMINTKDRVLNLTFLHIEHLTTVDRSIILEMVNLVLTSIQKISGYMIVGEPTINYA